MTSPKAPLDVSQEAATSSGNALHRSAGERALREVIDALLEGVVVQVRGHVAMANAAAARFFGVDPAAFVGRNILDLLSAGSHDFLARADKLNDNDSIEQDESVVLADGERRWCHITCTKTLIGNEPAIVMTLRDITLRKQTELELRESEERFRTLLEACPDAVLVHLEGRVAFANSAAARLYCKASPAELIDLEGSTLVPAQELSGLREWIKAVRRTGDLRPREFIIGYSDDATPRWGELRASTVQFHGKSALQLMVRDITERRRTERELRESEERYRALVEGSPDGIIVQRKNTILLANDASARLHGFDAASDIAGEDIAKFLPLSTISELETSLGHDAGNTAVAHEIPISNNKTGDVRWVEAIAKLIHVYGEPAMQLIYRDITERRQTAAQFQYLNETLEERVKQRTAELQAANNDLEAFCYSVSHDLLAPLRHISGHASLLLERTSVRADPQAEHHARRIINAISRFGQLLDNLLDFSRIGRSELRVKELSMNHIVQRVQGALQPTWHPRTIAWEVAGLPDNQGDASMIEQVWQNLLSNAIKYTRPRKAAVIEIGAIDAAAAVTYFVRDNGVGFDARYMNKLFGVFERLHSSSDFEGIGIGLANVRRIIERHGGRVWAEGAPQGGATFYFSLPRHSPALQSA